VGTSARMRERENRKRRWDVGRRPIEGILGEVERRRDLNRFGWSRKVAFVYVDGTGFGFRVDVGVDHYRCQIDAD
jgi:hypothetical protein